MNLENFLKLLQKAMQIATILMWRLFKTATFYNII